MMMTRWFALLSAAWLLAACAGQPTRDATTPSQRAAAINVQLGHGYIEQGKYDVALEKLKRAIKEDPNLPSAHHAIAFLYERLGQNDLADEHFRRALALDPDDSEAHYSYGNFLCRRSRHADAEAQYLAALKNPLYKSPALAYANAGACLMRVPDYVRAEPYLRQALTLESQQAGALYAMAELTLKTDRALAARGYLARFVEEHRHTAASLWLGIQIERRLGDQGAADSYALLLRRDFSDSREAQLLLGSGGDAGAGAR
jgi:type IV pilus assembly protein PilF